ncbi:MAG: MATE family efflux transporter [Planctomycetota bacterium]|jgi:putative MATE family efflux protein
MAARTERDLTRGPIPGHVLALAGPAILTALVHNLYGFNDIFFAQFVGVAAQTAVSNILFTLILIFGFVQLASIGTLTLVSRRTGSGNEEGADRAARQGLLFAGGISVVISGTLLATASLVPRLMGMAPDVTEEAKTYLTVLALGLPGMFLAPTVDVIFRARGDTRTPLLLQVIGVATNIVGNAAAVFVFDAGILGLSVSTVLSRLVWFLVGLALLRRGRVGIRLERRAGPLVDLGLWATLARIAAPIAARTALFGLIYQFVSRIAAGFGTGVQNGLGVGIRLEGLCFFVLVGFSMAAGPLVGQNLGAKRPDRAERAAWITAGMAAAAALAFTALFLLVPRWLMELLAEDEASIGHGADYLWAVSFSMAFMALEVVLAQAFVGAGDTIPPMVVDVPITASRIPLAWWVATGLGWGPAGIWWVICGTAVARGVFMALWFLRGYWKRSRPDLD